MDCEVVFMLQNKIAVVTGGTRGIGYAIVQKFLQNGAKVVLFGSREETVVKAVASLKEENPDWDVSGAWPKLTDAAAMVDEINKVKEKYGKIDILVNNAGITKDNLIMKMSEDDFDAVIATNLKGAFNCIKHVSRQMLKQRGGRIINISSVSGVMGNAGQANYCASKAGIIGLTKSVARELGSRGITSNAVAPGFIRTEMTDVLPEDVKKAMGEQIPLKHFGETKDIAEAVAFLASDEAAYITGQVLHVDGGMAM